MGCTTDTTGTRVGDLEKDLVSFSEVYMNKVTPEMVKISIGLRTPELYPYTAEGILKIPQVFKKVLIKKRANHIKILVFK